jgi:hypothetical protein
LREKWWDHVSEPPQTPEEKTMRSLEEAVNASLDAIIASWYKNNRITEQTSGTLTTVQQADLLSVLMGGVRTQIGRLAREIDALQARL